MPKSMLFCFPVKYLKSLHRLNKLYVNGIEAFTTLFHIEPNPVILADFADEPAVVNKNVFAGVGWLNKSESFLGVKKFYGTFFHCVF